MKFPIRHIVEDIFILSYILLFLKSFHFKFFWNIPESYFLLNTLVSSALYFWIKGKINVSVSVIPIMFLLFVVLLLQIISNGGAGIVGQMSTLLSMCCLMMSDKSINGKIFLAIRRVFAIICLISLIGWILVYILHCHFHYNIVSPLPGYSFYDFGFLNTRVEGVELTRYLGMFLEPGYTGILCTLFLVADGINLRKIDNVIILIASLFTLSLSSYVLLFISVLLLFPIKKLIKISFVLSVLCVIACILFPGVLNIIDETIWSRICKYYNSGRLFGNRFSDTFYVFYKEHIMDNAGHYLLGIGSVRYLELGKQFHLHSAGYKVYMAEYGIINTIIVIVLYWRIIMGEFSFRLKSFDIKFFFIWLLSFVVSSYPTWCSFLIFIITASFYRRSKMFELK